MTVIYFQIPWVDRKSCGMAIKISLRGYAKYSWDFEKTTTSGDLGRLEV